MGGKENEQIQNFILEWSIIPYTQLLEELAVLLLEPSPDKIYPNIPFSLATKGGHYGLDYRMGLNFLGEQTRVGPKVGLWARPPKGRVAELDLTAILGHYGGIEGGSILTRSKNKGIITHVPQSSVLKVNFCSPESDMESYSLEHVVRHWQNMIASLQT